MGFSNIGMALAYRDLQFGVEYRSAVTTKLDIGTGHAGHGLVLP